MKATLVMSFRMSNGKNTTVSITSSKDGLTGAEVNEVVRRQAGGTHTGAETVGEITKRRAKLTYQFDKSIQSASVFVMGDRQ